MKSAGHREHREHNVIESHVDQHMKVEVNGEVIAESDDVLKVDEDGAPPRYYFPRSDVKMNKLAPSDTTTKCPYKGTAHYYGLKSGGGTFTDAVWTYDEPYDEHSALRGRLAFYDDKIPQIDVHAA